MKTKIILLFLVAISVSMHSQTSSGSGTSTSGGTGTGIKIIISSRVNSNSIEILPNLDDAKVVGYKIFDSNLQLKKEATIQPTNNETISVDDLSKGNYYIQVLLDKEVDSKQIISKQFYKE